MPKKEMLIVICGLFMCTPSVDNARLPPVHCLPITDDEPCPPDHEIVPCTTRGTKDRCIPCAAGLRMCDATTSELMSRCHDPRETCSADGDNIVQVTDLPQGGCTIRCICNESAGFSGPDHLQCQSHDQACNQSSSHEFDSRLCLQCPENHHNPHDDGLDMCIPCSTIKPEHTLHVQPKTATHLPAETATTTAAPALLDTDNDSDSGDDMRSVNSLTDKLKDIGTVGYIGIAISILLLGIFGTVVRYFCIKRNGKSNAENSNCVCCVFAPVSNRTCARVNQADELQHLQESDTEPDEQRSIDPPGQSVDPPGQSVDPPGQSVDPPGQSVDPPGQSVDPPGQSVDPPGQSVDPPGQSVDPPGQSVDPPGQSVDPPGQSVDPPGQSVDPPGQSVDPPGQPGDNFSSAPPPYSQGQYRCPESATNFDHTTVSVSNHMTDRSPGPDTTHLKTEPELRAGQVPTSQDGPNAMTAKTATTPQGQLETHPKRVVQGRVDEVSETEKKIPVSSPVVSQRFTGERPNLLQCQRPSQAQPMAQRQGQHEVQPQPQPKTKDSLTDSESHIPGSHPPSLGGESLHLSSFNSE